MTIHPSTGDIPLQKLRGIGWVEVSDCQWRDIQGTSEFRAQLDRGYLRRYAPVLEVDALLERALEEGTE